MADYHGLTEEKGKGLPEGTELHPVIAAFEKSDEPTVVIEGFIGTGKSGVVRLYAALDVDTYVEIPESAIVHREADKAQPGFMRAYVRSDSRVMSVTRERLPAGDYTQGPRPPDIGPVQPKPNFWSCSAKCEASFAAAAATILEAQARALATVDPVRAERLFRAIDARKHFVKEALHLCLERCLATHGRPLMIGRVFSLETFFEEIVARHLEGPE
ncbi:hypothetical protein EON82_12020 [bacterium]|nr:MAG: hypothetical protein EON82_12020 [bacterium]